MRVRSSHAGLPLLLLLACGTSAAPSVVDPQSAGQTSAEQLATTPSTEPEAHPSSAFDHSHARWNGLLQANVKGDLFDYAAVNRDPGELKAYIEELAAVTPEELAAWTREQRYAFWINAYNAFTIEKIVDNYPLDSIRDLDKALGLSSVFDQEFIPLTAHHPEGDDDELSLNDIEHGILRPRFEDARVHAAVNCASAGCPPLRDEAFVPDRLEDQLEDQMRAFVRDPKRNVLDRKKERLRLSSIFKWFAEDFERDAGSVREYFLRYADTKDAEFVRTARIGYLEYSWDLNEPEAKEKGMR